MSSKHDVRVILDSLLDQGFTVEKVKSGHWKCTAPDGRTCHISATPRDRRNLLNHVTRLKRIGYEPPKK